MRDQAAQAAETSTAAPRTDIKHGVCKGPCGRRRILWMPAGLCERCLHAALDRARSVGKVKA